MNAKQKTSVTIELTKEVSAAADAVAVFLPEERAAAIDAPQLTPPEKRAVNQLIASGLARGKVREIASTLVELSKGGHRQVLVVGLGDPSELTPESLREAAGGLARAAVKRRVRRLAIVAPMDRFSPETVVEALATGLILAGFQFNEYKGLASRKESNDDQSCDVAMVVPGDQVRLMRPCLDVARTVAEAQNLARTIASRPGNDINPPSLARLAARIARDNKLGCRVLDEKQLSRLNMNGLLAVGSGSAHPPRLIVLEHKPHAGSSGTGTLLLVGKAITFDSGGISIKPAEKMGRMIFDKSGAMVVLGTMVAIARLGLPVHVVGLLAAAENLPSSTAYRPGDILRMHNGVTVEITNTDAEGRLVLADALAWGIETYKPSAVVDLATLTGGVVIALGKTIAGVMSNNENLVAELRRAAALTGEKIWHLPLFDEHREMLKSVPADIINSAGRDASPLTGGAFLSHFVSENTPWAHLDIAGVAETENELPYYAKGATGWGVRTLVEWVRTRASGL